MALISSRTILTSLSLFHITLGFFFLTNPVSVADQALVYVLGEVVGMPHSRAFDAPSPALAFLGVVLATVGISDLVSLSLPEEVCMVHYWGTQAPVRVLLAVAAVLYSFFGPSPARPKDVRRAAYMGGTLQNRVFFAYMFTEAISWCWLWVTLREERAQLQARKASRRRSQVYQ
ncbi:hypothetical protein SCUCBS95973_007910 [Sporothrix curviconia]|uniref:Increased loss of mitochondrial DNA protein 1 n=1 Tax=Sporothrix curviconia TaxID=1260050 RepID=A0ABP0CH62_9PEZI